MKYYTVIFSILLIALIGCSTKKVQINKFSSFNDTIVFKTEKLKGYGLFPAIAGFLNFRDTTGSYKFPVMFPKNINNIKISYQIIDYNIFNYDVLNNEVIWNNPAIKNNIVCVMTGQKENDTIFIFDENNNKDFRDDSIRLLQEYKWEKPIDLIKCKYFKRDGKGIIEDSTWVNIGTIGDNIGFSISHHLEATISFDGGIFQIGIIDEQNQYCFDYPILALISQNGIKKDTLTESELLRRGEYLKLNNSYYRFDNTSHYGECVTLVKEKNFTNKIGTQVGMIAPDFSCHSIDGDSISLQNYKGRYLLIINVSGCWSKVSSYKCYKDLTEYYKGKFDFLGLDNSPVVLKNNIKSLNLPGKFIIVDDNKALKKFRPDFCSRTCFLINPEGRIIDIFEIFDWKQNLTEVF